MTAAATASVDTSPAAIAARRRARIFELQDRALALKKDGLSNKEIGRTLDIPTRDAETAASIASQRRQAMESSLAPCDLDALALTTSEKMLLKALLATEFALWENGAVRMPESKHVAYRADRSHGWVSSTVRRRIGTWIAVEGQEFGGPGMGLVDVRGNGYIGLTASGWSACRALWPEAFA